MIKFFNPEQETQIIETIRAAEADTSGEIRVHLEKNSEEDVLGHAWKIFFEMGMHQTQARNGVLIFLAPERRAFAIVGDEGITQVAPEGFWDAERDLLQEHFRKGAFTEGLCLAIARVGEKLKTHFPYQSDDVNELPDDISYGD